MTAHGPHRGVFQGGVAAREVSAELSGYEERFEAPAAARGGHGAAVAKSYYQLVTDFYEFGWGQSFHFAPRRRGESVASSLAALERTLGAKLAAGPGKRLLDVGCGVGGPMRTIARATGAAVTGVSIAPYQIERARRHNERAGLAGLCTAIEADFNRLPLGAASFDGAYTMEACCHAEDRRGPFAEVFRCLRPGALFAGTDWCLTSQFRPGEQRHERIRSEIEKGNGVAALASTASLDAALRETGFDVIEARDLALESELPWFEPLRAGFSLNGFRNSRAGAFLTHQLVRALTAARVSPKGTVEVHDVLRLAQRALVEGGEAGVFTPIYFWLARKPGAKKQPL
ncbi:MAG: sterol methyltransferase family protein [Myxococcales bacterium]